LPIWLRPVFFLSEAQKNSLVSVRIRALVSRTRTPDPSNALAGSPVCLQPFPALSATLFGWNIHVALSAGKEHLFQRFPGMGKPTTFAVRLVSALSGTRSRHGPPERSAVSRRKNLPCGRHIDQGRPDEHGEFARGESAVSGPSPG